MPDDSEPCIYLFPYNFSADTNFRSPIMRGRESQLNQINQAYHVRCLLLPNPSFDYSALSKGFNCLTAEPVLVTNEEEKIMVEIENIPTEELSSLFISADTPYRLSIPFKIRCAGSLMINEQAEESISPVITTPLNTENK